MTALLSVTMYKNGEYANKIIYDYYQLKKQSKPGNVVLGAVMHKLGIIFSVLKNQKDFIMITPIQQCNLNKNNLKMIV